MGSVTMGGGGRAEKTTLKNSPSVRSSVGRGAVRGGGGGGAGGSNMGSGLASVQNMSYVNNLLP